MYFILKPLVLKAFIILLFYTQLYDFKLQPTRNVSIDTKMLMFGPIILYFECPYVTSKNDTINFYKVVKSKRVGIEEGNENRMMIQIKREYDLGVYECYVEYKDKIKRSATLNIMDIKKVESPLKFIYDIFEIKYVENNFAYVELDCGVKEDQHVSWFRPAQYNIHTGNKLRITNSSTLDYGTYYCAVGNISQTILTVTKFIVHPKEVKPKEGVIDKEFTFLDNTILNGTKINYRVAEMTDEADIITWEQPPGTILLNQGRDLYVEYNSTNQLILPFYYRINRYGSSKINKVGKILVLEWKDKEIKIFMEARVVYGGEVKMKCFTFAKEKNINIIWKRNERVIHHGMIYIIKSFDKFSFGNYSCEICKEDVKERCGMKTDKVIKSFLNLNPVGSSELKIKMTEDPGMLYNFHEGQRKELYCKIKTKTERDNLKTKKVMWTFNSEIILFRNNIRFQKIETLHKNILILKDMEKNNEGTYKCFVGSSVFSAMLLLERRDVKITIDPQIKNINETGKDVEFSCQIETPGLSSDLIKWSFKRSNSNKIEKLPQDVKVITIETESFITIKNVEEKHQGIYICQVLDKQVYGKLIVNVEQVNNNDDGRIDKFQCTMTDNTRKDVSSKDQALNDNVNRKSSLKMKENSILKGNQIFECTSKNIMYNYRAEIEIQLINERSKRYNLEQLVIATKNEFKTVMKEYEKNKVKIEQLTKIQKEEELESKKIKDELKTLKEDSDKRDDELKTLKKDFTKYQEETKRILKEESYKRDVKLEKQQTTVNKEIKDIKERSLKIKGDVENLNKSSIEKYVKLEEQLTTVNKEIKDIKEQSITIKDSVKTLKKDFIERDETTKKNVNQSIEESKMRVDSLTERIETLYLRTNVIGGEILFRVDRFSDRKTSGGIFFSPYFYSHFNGYKLRLAVYPGGYGRSKGTHLSLFFVIFKGEYDDQLSWPCKESIKLSVVNQSTGDDHVSGTFSHSSVSEENKQCFNKPINKDNLSLGYASFISLADLQKVILNDVVHVRARVSPERTLTKIN